mgnify:CR=1 FL=1
MAASLRARRDGDRPFPPSARPVKGSRVPRRTRGRSWLHLETSSAACGDTRVKHRSLLTIHSSEYGLHFGRRGRAALRFDGADRGRQDMCGRTRRGGDRSQDGLAFSTIFGGDGGGRHFGGGAGLRAQASGGLPVAKASSPQMRCRAASSAAARR